jgi:hypothetical protein
MKNQSLTVADHLHHPHPRRPGPQADYRLPRQVSGRQALGAQGAVQPRNSRCGGALDVVLFGDE